MGTVNSFVSHVFKSDSGKHGGTQPAILVRIRDANFRGAGVGIEHIRNE